MAAYPGYMLPTTTLQETAQTAGTASAWFPQSDLLGWQAAALAFGVPLIFVFMSAMGKKLVRGQWMRQDCYLGCELTLAALSADILHSVESIRARAFEASISALLFAALSFGIYLWLLTLHQDWERPGQPAKAQMWRLGLVSNLAGIVLFATFVFLIRRPR